MTKKSVNEQMDAFFNLWGIEQLKEFIRATYPLFELYNVDENDDWVKDIVGEESKNDIRLARTVYLLSRFCEQFSGLCARTRSTYPGLWEMMDEQSKKTDE